MGVFHPDLVGIQVRVMQRLHEHDGGIIMLHDTKKATAAMLPPRKAAVMRTETTGASGAKASTTAATPRPAMAAVPTRDDLVAESESARTSCHRFGSGGT